MNEDHYKYRNELLKQYVYLAFIIALPLVPVEYYSGLVNLSATLLLFAVAMVPLLIRIRSSEHYQSNSRYFMLMITGLFLAGFLFSTPEIDNKYFLLLYPIAAFSIRGVKEGIVWSGLLLFSFVFLYWSFPEQHTLYSFIYFLVAFFMVGYVVFHYRYYEILNFKHIQKMDKQKDLLLNEKDLEAKKFSEQSETDFLTQLANRKKLDLLLKQLKQSSDGNGEVFSVILLDVDHFKQVNDSHGHQIGDQVLQIFADRLQRHIRATDYVGRWGGEEFMIISPSTGLEGAVSLAEKIREVIELHSFPEVGHKTASFGVASYQKGESLSQLVDRCDLALYQAKNAGRNTVRSLELELDGF